MLLPLTLASVILSLSLKLRSDEVHVADFFLPLGWIGAKVFIMCHSLTKVKADTIQDEIDQVMIHNFEVDIESIDIIQVFLDSTCILEITDLVVSPIWLIVVAIVLPNCILTFFPGNIPMPVSLPQLQFFTFYA